MSCFSLWIFGSWLQEVWYVCITEAWVLAYSLVLSVLRLHYILHVFAITVGITWWTVTDDKWRRRQSCLHCLINRWYLGVMQCRANSSKTQPCGTKSNENKNTACHIKNLILFYSEVKQNRKLVWRLNIRFLNQDRNISKTFQSQWILVLLWRWPASFMEKNRNLTAVFCTYDSAAESRLC